MHTPVSADEERARGLWEINIDVAQCRGRSSVMLVCQVLDKDLDGGSHYLRS